MQQCSKLIRLCTALVGQQEQGKPGEKSFPLPLWKSGSMNMEWPLS
jgi:hypothetical protein